MALLNPKNILILGITAFLVVNFWSLYFMPVDMGGKMVSCPFMDNSSSFCTMSISEHINLWQQLFNIIREKSLLLSLFSILIFLQIAIAAIISKEHDRLIYQQFRNYLYRHRPEIKLFDMLVLYFSDGTIHPKIYA